MQTIDKITAYGLGLFGAWVAYRFIKGYVVERRVEGIGRVKRRIYKEVSLAQQAGVDFSDKDYPKSKASILDQLGKNAGWKQSTISINSGKTYAEAYYNSLRRAWNAVCGVKGVGTPYREYTVKNTQGQPALAWRDYDDKTFASIIQHVEQEESLEDVEERLRKMRNRLTVFDHSVSPASGYRYGSGYRSMSLENMSLRERYQALLRYGYTESEAYRMASNM